MMGAIDISKLSKKSGLPASTIRFYEEKNLIKSIGRNGLKRTFDTYVLEQLEFIALGQRAGFSLDEIQSMLTTKGRFEVNRESLTARAQEIAQRVKQLVAIQRCLEHAAKCTAERHSECPKFQKLLRIAGKDQARKHKTVITAAAKRP
ncbi:helix-turn-helix domain-containing protein [Rheinheimera aquimaris]|uniref:helix-turn-helix domain-containing protein n=1 Tax=Rheinheimera aquimaris TaxID=412437 RepID=UPI003A96B394